jgi:hypothetical protein
MVFIFVYSLKTRVIFFKDLAKNHEPISKRLFNEMSIRGLRLLIELHKKFTSSDE